MSEKRGETDRLRKDLFHTLKGIPHQKGWRARRQALAGRVPTWSPELAITGKPGGKGALEEALAQSAGERD